MAINHECSEDELPDLKTILLPCTMQGESAPPPLRRSPRKHVKTSPRREHLSSVAHITFTATSNQRRLSPAKKSSTKNSVLGEIPQGDGKASIFEGIPVLSRKTIQYDATVSISNGRRPDRSLRSLKAHEADSLLDSFSRLAVKSKESDTEEGSIAVKRIDKREGKGNKSGRHGASRSVAAKSSDDRKPKRTLHASQFVLDEARCEEDLLDSDAQDEGEDEDTDLSGFIVDDDAEISCHDSTDGIDSEEESMLRKQRAEKSRPRRKLQRGRKIQATSDEDIDQDDDLSNALAKVKLDEHHNNEHQEGNKTVVIDLISPEHQRLDKEPPQDLFKGSKAQGINLFDKFKALKLWPPRSSQILEIPSKSQSTMWQPLDEDINEPEITERNRYATPPGTPPRSPSKLKSPSKLMSPSKRGDAVQKSPHRQSMDAFWDLNEVNEWNDQFSPKKAPIASPKKNRFLAFDDWSDIEEEKLDDSSEGINESSDSLPSPCESPSKSRTQSPVKAEKQRILSEKKAKQAERARFENTKVQMANDLLQALDKHVTNSRISVLSASTGGVQIIWSKTLRSTAGRANWRRTVTKPTGSPIKGKSEESAPGTTVTHFANIELAVKVIDRPDRLVNTLAHEFCHLANFMVSGIRDQPHGASFQDWARKVTSWMKTQTEVPEWKGVEVTTKHSYVIEWKYLWICAGRSQNKAMELLNIDEDDEGCGAEYGRHSKSIDTETQRCGRCKGRLVQVRPKPRASPAKNTRTRSKVGGVAPAKNKNGLEKMVKVIELSD